MPLGSERSVRPNPSKHGLSALRYLWPTPGSNKTILENNYFNVFIPPPGSVQWFDGSGPGEWKVGFCKIWDGTDWVQKPAKYHDGTSWVIT